MNKNSMLKIFLLAVAGILLLLLASGQFGRWRFRRKVVQHFERLYPDDKFHFAGRIRKKSIWHGPLARFADGFNPTGSRSHPFYWWKYEGDLVSERLGGAFRVGGKPGRERSGGNWATAYFHDTWTEIPGLHPGWPAGLVYEDELELRLADSIYTIWDELMPDLEVRRDYNLLRGRRLYVGWWEAFSNLRNETHIRTHRGVETRHRFEPMPDGAVADLHARLHSQRNFDAYFFRDSANAARLTSQRIAAKLESFARRAATEAGIDGLLRGTVIDRGALARDIPMLNDLFRKSDRDRGYKEWSEEYRKLYDALKNGTSLTQEQLETFVKIIGSSAGEMERLDRYILGRFEIPFASDAVIRGVYLPAEPMDSMDAVLQEEMLRAFGRDAYGRFEPYKTMAPLPAAADQPPRDGWQATVFVMADSGMALPTEQAVTGFAERLSRKTGLGMTVDVYALSAPALRYDWALKSRLLTSDDLAETSQDTYWLGTIEALFREPDLPYRYLELSEFDLERLNNPQRRQPDALPEGSEEAFFRLMRPRADFDVRMLLDGGDRPVILRHYRVLDGHTSDLTDANPVTEEVLRQYRKRCPADAFTDREKARRQRAQEELRKLEAHI